MESSSTFFAQRTRHRKLCSYVAEPKELSNFDIIQIAGSATLHTTHLSSTDLSTVLSDP
jgi:hypothetical protein